MTDKLSAAVFAAFVLLAVFLAVSVCVSVWHKCRAAGFSRAYCALMVTR